MEESPLLRRRPRITTREAGSARMICIQKVPRSAAGLAAVASMLLLAAAPSPAVAAGGFGPLSGSNGCLVAPGMGSAGKGTAGFGEGRGLIQPNAVAVSPDGANVYVASGTAGSTVASSFGSLAILK